MSEKQAKRERKAQMAVAAPVRKRNSKRVIANTAIVLIVAAVAALGSWAAYEKISSQPAAPVNTDTTAENAQEETTTVAHLAKMWGITAEELLEKCGMTNEGLTAESSADEFLALITVEGYAKYTNEDVDTLKAKNGIENVSNDELWQVAQMQIPMSKLAEQYGMSFEDFAKQNNFPESITADMTQGQAMTIMQLTQATEETEE